MHGMNNKKKISNDKQTKANRVILSRRTSATNNQLNNQSNKQTMPVRGEQERSGSVEKEEIMRKGKGR